MDTTWKCKQRYICVCTSPLAVQIPARRANEEDQVLITEIRSPSLLLHRFLETCGCPFSLSHSKTFPMTSYHHGSPGLSMTYIGYCSSCHLKIQNRSDPVLVSTQPRAKVSSLAWHQISLVSATSCPPQHLPLLSLVYMYIAWTTSTSQPFPSRPCKVHRVSQTWHASCFWLARVSYYHIQVCSFGGQGSLLYPKVSREEMTKCLFSLLS